MKLPLRVSSLLVAAFLLSCTAACAESIAYSETFVASGKLGTTSFTNQVVTLVFTGDSSDVSVINEGPYDVSLITGTGDTEVTVGSLGTYAVTDDMEVYDYGAGDPEAFLDMGINNYDPYVKASLETSVYNTAFGSYTLEGALSEVDGDSSNRSATSSASGYLDTADGKLTISKDTKTSFTFEASPVVTPEPSSLVLLGTGLLGLMGVARRKLRLS